MILTGIFVTALIIMFIIVIILELSSNEEIAIKEPTKEEIQELVKETVKDTYSKYLNNRKF